MKNIIAFIVICFIAAACNVGIKKDLMTGLTVSNNGLSIREAMLVDDQNNKTTSNEVSVDKTIAIVVDGIGNYQLKDGHAFPGVNLTVTDKNGTVVLEGKDILANDEGYSAEDASVLRGSFTVGTPMVAGETYHAKMQITDKLKPENEITAEVDIVVKQ